GYGVSLAVGLGVPIPVLDEEVMRHAALGDEDLVTQVVDYSHDYPEMIARSLGEVSYAQLRSGSVTIQGREVPTVSLSSLAKARKIAATLKAWIAAGEFTLAAPAEPLPGPGSGIALKALHERAKRH
ncbi:MAG TPA: homocysteine biosynthesis protein, partial [Candidatus Methanoperedens sp.]|nr:homocysteine biosynthesis protein [Candidatus Methanoperedens sp.]